MQRYFAGPLFAAAMAAALAGPASAVSVVVPKAYASNAGSGNFNGLFGAGPSSTGFTTQLAFSATQLNGIATGSLLTAIGFRLYSFAGTINQALDYTSFDVQVGSSRSSIATLSRTFSDNQASNTILARSGPLSIAAGTFIGNRRVNPFYTIALTTPFVYTGGDLLLTIRDTLAAGTIGVYVPLDAILPNSSLGNVAGASETGTRGTANSFYAPITQLTFAAPRATTSPAPEPVTWVSMLLGFGLLGSAMRRKRPSAFASDRCRTPACSSAG